jgi:hypothetical protein
VSERDNHIKISFKVEIPVGVAVQVQPEGSSDGHPPLHPQMADTDLRSIDPDAGVTKSVRPSSQSALGTICARVVFNLTPDDVRARVYPEDSPTIPSSPPSSATQGVKDATDSTGMTWVWNDAKTAPHPGCAIPRTDHLPATAATLPTSTFVVWYKKPSATTWSMLTPRQFQGKTGTSGFCGTGSGSGTMTPAVSTHPAVWSVEMKGFHGPEAAFNNSWTLRRTSEERALAWVNQGDAEHSPRLELVHRPEEHEWELTARLGKHGFRAGAYSHSRFGPLRFHPAKAEGAREGLPEVVATPM